MREALALMRVSWLAALSYRTQMAFGVVGLVLSVLPLYFISGALQPMMEASIRGEGQQYFAFLVVGLVTTAFVTSAVNGLPTAMSTDISTGALEAMLATPARIPALLVGMVGQQFTWTVLRGIILLSSAWFLGAQVVWSHLAVAAVVLLLIVLTYAPVGVIAAALILAVRTAGPLATGVVWGSTLLGGVYYPTNVVPSWLAVVSDFVPLTYGLRALRRSLIEGASTTAIMGDVARMVALGAVLFVAGVVMFTWALRHAKRAGTLAQY
jgi:ABC-2 type transport system permease protein